MAKLLVTTTSIADDIVDEEKPMSDVVNAEFDKGTYEEKFVPEVVMALEAKTSELENTKETKIGEGNELMQGEVEFVEKNGSLVTMDTKKIEMRVVEVTKGAVDGSLGELDTTIGKTTTEGVMAATSVVSNVELEAAEKVQGGGTDEVEFAEDDCKSGCLTLVEASNTKEKATVASETTKGQVEAVYDSELVEGDLEDKNDDMVVAVSQVGSIKVPMAKDADDVVVEGQDDVLAAHIRKSRIGHSRLETYEVPEDESAIMLCGVDEKHGGTDPTEVMIAVDGKLAKNSQSLVEGEFLMKNAPWVPLPLVQTMDNALGEVEQIGGTLETKDSELQTAVSKLRIAAATTVEGEFAQDGVETRVAKSCKKDACLDSLDVLVEAHIMLDQGEKNRDVMEIKNEEVMLVEEGEMSNDSRPTLESEFVDEDITLVSLEETNFDLEATFGKVEDIGPTLEQEDDQVVTLVVMDLAQDCLMAVKDKSVKESTSLATLDILEKEVKLTICKEIEIDVPRRPMDGEATLSDEQASVKNWKTTAESDFFDEDVSLLSLHEPKSELEASSGEVDKTNATYEENDTQAITKAFGEVVQDVMATRVVEPSMEHTSVTFQHIPKGKASITLDGVGEKDDNIGFKCLGVVHTSTEELVVDSRATTKDELHKEDAPLVLLHSLQMDLDPIVEEEEDTGAIHVEKVSEVANTIDTKLYEADRIDATLVECVATNRVEGDFAQDGLQMTVAKSGEKDEYVDSYDAKVEAETILGQSDENYNVMNAKYDEALLPKQGEMVKGPVVVVDSEFVADNFLASPDAMKVELDISPDDVKKIGAMMEQECSQVVIPQDGLTIVEAETIEGSATLSTQKDLQSKEELGQIKGEEKHFQTKMELVEESHMAQEGNMIINSTLVSSRAPECDVEIISGEVDGMNALSNDTWTLTEDDEEVIQDVLAAHMVDTTSSEVDNAIRKLDKMEATFEVEESQTLTDVAIEDTQDVMVTCVMEPTMGYTYLGGEKEKETSMEPWFSKVVEAEGKLAIDLHVSTVMEEAPFNPLHAKEIDSDPSLGKVEQIEATLEAKESESMVVVNTKLGQTQEVDVTLAELRSTTPIMVEGEFTQDVSETVAPESRKKDRYFESMDLQEDVELMLFHDDKKYDTMEAMFEDVVPTVEGELERDLQGKLDNDFVIEDAPSVYIHSSQIDLDATLEEEEEIGASLIEKDNEATTAINTKLYEVGRIGATLVECVATTRVDGEFSQDGWEMTAAKSAKKDEYVDSSDVIVEPEIILGQNDENYEAKKAIYEEAILIEEGEMVKGLVVAVDSELVADNLLVSPDAAKVELHFSLEDVKEIGATMEQECCQVMIPQDGLIIVEAAPIEGSTSLSTQNVLQSKQMSTLGEGEEKQFLKVTTNDDATVPIEMELVEDWHLSQEGNMFIECTSLGSLRAPEVDGMNAMSNDTCTPNESDQEVTQDVLAAHTVDTTSGGIDNAISESDEMEPTFKAKESQTLTQEGIEDTQDVSVTCAMEPSMGYTILATHDVLEVEAFMMLGGEEEKDISTDPNFPKVIVDARGKAATDLHAWAIMEKAPCIPLHAQEIDSDATMGEVEDIVATSEAKESESMVVVNVKLDQPQEVDATLVDLSSTKSTVVEGKFTQDVSETVMPKSSKKDTCFESSDRLEEAELMLDHEDTNYDTMEAMFEDVVSAVEDNLERDLHGKSDNKFVIEDASLVCIHSLEIDLDATIEEEKELGANLVKKDNDVTTATSTKLCQVDRIDATLVEYTTTTRDEGEFAQDGLEMTVAESRSKDKYADSSYVMVEEEIVSCQNDQYYNAMKAKYEEAVLEEEDKMVKDPTVAVDSDFVAHNLLASSDTSKVDLDVSLVGVKEIGATMEQECSQVMIPQDELIIVDDAPIKGSISLSTQNVLQSKEMSALGKGEEQHFLKVTTKEDATIPTEMELVEDWHVKQEGNMLNECTSLGSLCAPECEVETISSEVDGMNAMSNDTCTLNGADQEVTQDELAAHRVDTTSGGVDNAIRELDEMEATFKAEESQTLTQAAIEDTQDVSVTCAMETSMGYPILATHDVLEVEAVMMLGREDEKDTSTDPNFAKVIVDAGGKMAMDLHAWTVMEEAPCIPLHTQEIDSDASLGEVEEMVAPFEAKECESMVVVDTKLHEPQEVDATLVELCSTKSTAVEGKFTQDELETVVPKSSKKDTCFESSNMLEEAEFMLVHEDTKYDTMEAMFEVVVSTVEGKPERDLQGKLDSEFVIGSARLVREHSSKMELDATLEEEMELGACLVKNDSETTTATDTKLYEMDRIDTTLVEYTATTRVEGEFAQDGLEMTVAELGSKDKSVDFSDVMEEAEIVSGQNDENYNAMKAKYEEALLAEEDEMVKDPTVAVDNDFIADNLLASSDTMKVELDVSLEDVIEIGATMEQGCSQVLIPQDGLIKVEDAPIEGSTSLTTHNVLQSKEMSTLGEGEEKHFLNMATKDDATLPTEIEVVEDWHMAQEGNMFIECTSFGSLHSPECEVETISSTEVDGMNAMSNDTCTLNEADLEVTQDVLVAHRVDTISGVVDNAIRELDEIEATFKAEKSQTLTQSAVKDTQDVSVTCAMEASMGYPILATHDFLEVEAVMTFSGEEEKNTSTDANFAKVTVEVGSKVAMDLHAWTVMEEVPIIPLHAKETHSDVSLGEVEEIVATLEAKESKSVVVVNTKLNQPQEVDSALVELCSTKSTAVEGKFTQDVSETMVPESSKKDTCFESSHMLEEEELMLVSEDTKYDTMEAMFEDVVSTVEGKPERDLQGKLDREFVIEGAPLVRMHSSEMELGPTLEEETELGASLVKKDSETTTATHTKLYDVDRIDVTLVEYTATTSVEGKFDQDGLEMTVAESGSKDKFADSSNVMVEVEIVSSQNDDNYIAMKAKFEDALLAKEDQMVKDPAVAVDSEFVADNLLAFPDTMKIELDVSLVDVKELGATMEQECSQVMIPQDGLIIVEDAPIEGSTSLSTPNVLQSKEMSALGEGEGKHFLRVKRNISVKVAGMDAISKDTWTLIEGNQEVTQDVLAAHMVDTTSGEVNTSLGEFNEMEAHVLSLDAREINSNALLGEMEEIEATLEAKESGSMVAVHTNLDQPHEVDATLVESHSTITTKVEGKFTQEISETMVPESIKKDTRLVFPNMLEEAELVLVQEDKNYDVVLTVEGELVEDLQGKRDNEYVKEDTLLVSLDATKAELVTTLDEVGMTSVPLEQENNHAATPIDRESTSFATINVCESETKLVVDVLLQNDDPRMATEAKEMLSAERGLIKDWRTAPEPKDIEVMTEVEQEPAQVQLQKLQGELGTEFTSLVSNDVSEGEVEGVLVKDDYNNVCQEGKDTEAVTTNVSFANAEQASPAGQLGNKGALIVPLDMLEGEVDSAFCMEIQKDASIHEKDGKEDMTIDWELVKDEKTTQDVELGMIGICLASAEVPGGEVNAAINEENEKGEVNASVTDNLLAHELAPQNKTMDGDTNEMNVVGEVVESNKEQPLSFDVIADGNTANDDIVLVSYNDEICDDCGKIAEENDRASFDERPAQVAILDSSDASKQDDTEDNDNNDDGDEEGLCSGVLASHLKPATSTSLGGNITVASQDTSIFSVDRAADLGSSDPSLRPNATLPPSGLSIPFPSELETTPNTIEAMTEDEKKLHEKLELIRVKFLHLLCRMGATPEEAVAAQVLYGPSLAEGIHHGRAFSLENAWIKELQQEDQNREDLSFSCNILVLGKTGVGKSATINSIFGEEKSKTDAFDASTTNVREISGSLDGIQVHIIDTPGLRTNVTDQGWNKKILSAVKSYTKKCPPDMILYVDRLDSWSRDDDLPLLRTITATLGTSIWLNAIVALTHAASAPPDSSNGDPVAYETLIAHRSHIIQQSIRQAASDMRLMNSVALVENHPYCQRNRQGQMVLPNGLAWRNQLLLLCYSTKTLFEANSLLKLQDPSPREQSGFGFRSLPLPFLLSSLLQPRSHRKLSDDHGGDKEDSDVDLDDYSDICDDEDEYDRLPPFSPLTKAQLHKLTKDQKNEYLDEYDNRIKLLQKKQWKGRLQLKEMKKRGKAEQDSYGYGNMAVENDQDHPPENVAVPLPDMVLPPSFDSDDPTYQYRFLEPTSTIISRPVLNVHAWDHDCGFDGVSLDGTLAIARKFPAAVSVQLTKDKKELNIHLDSSISGKHGENTSSLASFDVQTVRRELAYVLRGETTFKNIKKNKTTGGFSVTFLGNTMATGVKVEDQLSVGKSLSLVASTGAMRAQGDTACGANMEARLKDKDYPINQYMLVLGLSLMKWRGDLALGANIQSQFSVGRGSKMALHIGLDNKLSGQINVKMSTSEQVQMALLGLVPLAASIYKSFRPAEA